MAAQPIPQNPPQDFEPLYMAQGRWLLAIDPASGVELWRAKCGGRFGVAMTTFIVSDDALFVARGPTLWRVNRWTGQVEWERKLPGLSGSAMLGRVGADMQYQQMILAAAALQQQQAAAAAAG